jgi:outer membrane lipoprotein SlyB
VGLVAGGLVGGLPGDQVGHGKGNTAATIVGAGAGSFAGNRVEQARSRSTARHEVLVKMGDGSTQNLSLLADSGVKTGEKVRVADRRVFRLP